MYERYRQVMPGASKNATRGQILTDCMLQRGTVKAAEARVNAEHGRIWLYQFNWSSPVMNGAIGAMHGIDVPFANQNLEAFSRLLGDLEPLREMADTVSDTWVNFARHGVPSANRLPHWEPFDLQRRPTMIFDNQIEMQYDVDRAMREIWDG